MKTDTPEIQAIPTTYKGIEFRSRLEATVAQFMDRVRWSWEYEPKSFLLRSGIHYMPDFYVARANGRGLWVECRGYITAKGENQLAQFPLTLLDEGRSEDFLILHAQAEVRDCALVSWVALKACRILGVIDKELPIHGSTPWLYRCSACSRYEVFGAAVLEHHCCNYCGGVSPEMRIQRIEFEPPEGLFVGRIPMSEWRPE